MFDIRPYAKAELASLYSPNIAPRSAVKTLVRWINGCPMLVEELRALNYQPHRHSFLKPEVEAICKAFGRAVIEFCSKKIGKYLLFSKKHSTFTQGKLFGFCD